mmetsp:Transcript_49347/g.154778  ORF Transcript_49347/g.154778 Transcript_49347/m.154778 type:complete len:135 (+) Transcript_49347:333-737(+)
MSGEELIFSSACKIRSSRCVSEPHVLINVTLATGLSTSAMEERDEQDDEYDECMSLDLRNRLGGGRGGGEPSSSSSSSSTGWTKGVIFSDKLLESDAQRSMLFAGSADEKNDKVGEEGDDDDEWGSEGARARGA